jgi:hypothetical protein
MNASRPFRERCPKDREGTNLNLSFDLSLKNECQLKLSKVCRNKGWPTLERLLPF